MRRRRSLLAYNSLINAMPTIPTNEIWYTSTDGNIVTPYSANVFGASIISNTYSDGKGIIKFDGNVTTIGDLAFHGCSSLTSVTIGNGVTEIGNSAFSICSSLLSITIPDSVTDIGRAAFISCYGLTNITIPDSVVSIGEAAFRDCTSLESFYGKFASEDNRCLIVDGKLIAFAPAGLTEYTIPDSVTSIGEAAFQGSELTSVTIPDSVITIEGSAFSGCYSLTSIIIPNGVTTIGEEAFIDCDSLTSVYCKPTTPPAGGDSMFGWAFGILLRIKIYVPYQSLDTYKAAEYWSEYADNIVGYDFEKNLIYNKCVVSGNTVTFDYPVATALTLYYTTNMGSTRDAILKDTISKNITLGPGETLISIDSISPTEDAIYVYDIA